MTGDKTMSEFFFKEVLLFDGERFFQGSLVVSGDRIVRMGPDIPLPEEGNAIAQGERWLVMPGMVNLHTHVPMALFKGVAEDLPLADWLEKRIFPLEARFISRGMCRLAGQWGMAEMLRAGVTAFADMYFFEEEIAAAAREIGIKVCMGEGVINFPAPTGRSPEETVAYTAHLAETYRNDPWVFPACAPHSPYLTDERYLTALDEISARYHIPFHIHMAETEAEQTAFFERHGKREFEHFAALGLLSERMIAAHCVWLSPEETALIARHGVTVVHCPSSNLKLGSGIAPVAEILAHGGKVAVGTDGSASNNNLDLLAEAELAAKVQKGVTRDPTVLPAITALRMVTSIPGAALGGSFGRLIEGGSADLVLVRLDGSDLAPVYDPAAALIYAASPRDIAGVWVNGRKVVEEGTILSVDLPRLGTEIARMADVVRRTLA